MQLQPLASWGKVNWLARTCLDDRTRAACPVRELRRNVDALLALAAHRGDFLAWEHYFEWSGGTPPWISGMTQATAVSALARAARALDEPRWRKAAHQALGAFDAAPPLGVDGGDHFLMYSFAPSLRIFNGELQAVSGIGELAALYRDRRANRLFRRAERGARAMVAASDTGAWSLYSFAGREATLGYHQLIEQFLGDMCTHTEPPRLLRRRAAVRPLPARADAHRDRAAAAPARQATHLRALLDLEDLDRQGPPLRPHRDHLQPRPHAAPRAAPARLDAAVARALPAADRGRRAERPGRRQGADVPGRSPQAEAEEVG